MLRGKRRVGLFLLLVSVLLAVAGVASLRGTGGESESLRSLAKHDNLHARALAIINEKTRNGGEAGTTIAEQRYDDQAYPNATIGFPQTFAAQTAWARVARFAGGKHANWQELGPTSPFVPGPVTYTGRPTENSGRVTALAVAPGCRHHDCKLFVGAAGGGVWEADNALSPQPNWRPANAGIPSNAIGSLYFAPDGKTLYAGTGEPNGSGDSEAGVGLFRSTDLGKSWSLVPGSVAAAKDRSIAAVAVDPADPNHIWIGTAVARHGSSSVNGGRFTPPGAPTVGLYESTDGGASFSLVFSEPSDVVDPTTANGGDFFRGGVSSIRWDSLSNRIYFSIFDYGLYRQKAGGGYEQIFTSECAGDQGCSASGRTEFALAPLAGGKLRIYVGDSGFSEATFWRTDDANVAVPSFTQLSDPTNGSPGFGSFNFCNNQCSYDMVVASPAGRPDEVWIGGRMQYGEIFGVDNGLPFPFRSNGRAVQRSTDGGVSFTDMTNDTQSPPLGMHPDQHAIAFTDDGSLAFLGSDGGVVRTSGQYADASSQCASRTTGLGSPTPISGADLADCQQWLSAIPTQLISLNRGLATLQFQSVSLNPANPADLLGGTQDNGTWANSSKVHGSSGHANGSWFESVGGDGGQSGIDVGNAKMRIHSYFLPQHDVNFRGTDPLGWDWVSDPLFLSGEGGISSFYPPLVTDPAVSGTIFDGLLHVWRTQDFGGNQAYLDLHCNEFSGDFAAQCGDWVPLGGDAGNLVSGLSSDKGTGYIVALARAKSNSATLWAGTRRGRLFISENANAAADAVTFTRLDTPAQPRRFISGISVDPANPRHAFVSFSGYDAYTPTTPGHVFEVTFDGSTATWTDRSGDLGDQPVTGIAVDWRSGDVYASTDFGVTTLRSGGSQWVPAAGNLPPVAVYGLTIDANYQVLYAATHGRGIWKLDLRKS